MKPIMAVFPFIDGAFLPATSIQSSDTPPFPPTMKVNFRGKNLSAIRILAAVLAFLPAFAWADLPVHIRPVSKPMTDPYWTAAKLEQDISATFDE